MCEMFSVFIFTSLTHVVAHTLKMVSIKVIFVCLSYFVFQAHGVDFIDPCGRTDAKCILESAKKAMPYLVRGIPELEIPACDPLQHDKITIAEGGLKLTLTDITFEGIKECKMTKVERNLEESSIQFNAECPFTVTGQYKLDGQLFVIPVQGSGGFSIKGANLEIKTDNKIKEVDGKDGKKHWKIVSTDFKFEAKQKVDFNFENLFGGDKTKAEPVLKILNENWKDLISTFGKPVLDVVIAKISENLNVFLKKVPTDQLELKL